MKFNESFDKYMSLYNEAKEAPKGKHYDKAGRLQSGDADSDGRGGPKFRSDPTYKNPNESEEHKEDCESCGCSGEDCETCGCQENPEYGHLDDTYSNYIDQYEPKEDNEYDMGEVLDGVAADFANDMTKSELEAKYGTDAVAKFIKYGDEDGHPSEDAERVDKDRMKCNKPRRTSGGSKKFVVKACKDGKEKVVRFGDPNMKIKKSNPKRRKSFRARHKCDQKKDKFSAGYWSCKKW